jgi:diacylglycerol O-acyltransferase / wax synthase
MSLASERSSTPMQVGAILMLDAPEGLDPARVGAAIAARVCAVPRLRQRLVHLPWGCGRPIWVDDRHFTVDNHLSQLPCPAPGGDSAVLRVAAQMLVTRLPRDRPLWAARLVTDTGHGGAALIVVFHHVLADGIGGLAVLASLVDGASPAADALFPRAVPSRRELAADAASERLHSGRGMRAAMRRLLSGASELRPGLGTRAAPSSLNRPTGPRRRVATVRVDLDDIRSAAHAHQATINDVILSAIAAALHRILALRGERIDQFVISVPFSARRDAGPADLGNQSGIIPIAVSGVGDPVERLEPLAAVTRAARRSERGASTAVLSPFFRVLAHVGLFRWFIDRQRVIHTFVTNLHGPESRLSMVGCPITGIVPLSVATGNVTVSFAVLSYAGSLTVALIADPDTCPDLSELRDVLEEELGAVTAPTVDSGYDPMAQ